MNEKLRAAPGVCCLHPLNWVPNKVLDGTFEEIPQICFACHFLCYCVAEIFDEVEILELA